MLELIRQLSGDDAADFQALRLQGLTECPTAFASSHAEEAGQAVAAVAKRLRSDGVFGVYGALDEQRRLVGVAGLGRESMRRLAHKGVLWGMYVAPQARRQGVGRRIVSHVLARAAGADGLRQVNLGVHAGNIAARALYESLGFVAWGTEPAAAWDELGPHDETWMTCVLPGRTLP
jgi:RimJ/RimL family protein N-acetyltransferase